MKLVLQVQETQQHLQDLELAMDLKESRVRKLEYELKLLSGMSLQIWSFSGHQVDESRLIVPTLIRNYLKNLTMSWCLIFFIIFCINSFFKAFNLTFLPRLQS